MISLKESKSLMAFLSFIYGYGFLKLVGKRLFSMKWFKSTNVREHNHKQIELLKFEIKNSHNT